jgi:hypothetical protein
MKTKNYEGLKHIGDDNFYVVPMKAIGFRPCVRQTMFRKHGKLEPWLKKLDDDEVTDGYYKPDGYWWDTRTHTNMSRPRQVNDSYEYYYFLHKDYQDT